MGKRNWDEVISELNNSKSGKRSIKMGSSGSAQVTRCRLLKEYDGLHAKTMGEMLILSLEPIAA